MKTKSVFNDTFKGQIIGYQQARLIPNFSSTSKELLSTSVLLAAFEIVPTFADELFSDIGVKIGSRSKLNCATEVVFKSDTKKRPDGLILIKSPTKSWSALIETKILRNDLTPEQVEDYLLIAKKHRIDAVITISNQFALRPTHHPLQISKTKTRSVDLYHFSWSAILGEALLAASSKKFDDPEQARIMEEVTYYLKNTATCDLLMRSGWKDTCDLIRQESNISKTSDEIRDAVLSWQQLLRHCALGLSAILENPVTVYLTKAKLQDPILNLKADCEQLASEYRLTALFEVPNGASRIEMIADFKTKALNFRMKLKAPDSNSISKATASMNWLTRQLREEPNAKDLRIRAFWPRRSNTTDELFNEVLENPKVLIPDGMKELPTYLEIQSDVDLGATFKSVRKAAQAVEQALINFYMSYGENLTAWNPKPIKVKPAKVDRETNSVLDV